MESKKSIVLRIHLLKKDYLTKGIELPENATVMDAFVHIVDKLDIVYPSLWALYVQYPLENDFQVALDFNSTLKDANITKKSIIIFKVRYWKLFSSNRLKRDNSGEELIFEQLHHLVLSEGLTCSENQAVRFAAISLHHTYGVFDPSKHKVGFLDKIGQDNLLPKTNISDHDFHYWQERMFSIYKTFGGKTKIDARRLYIEEAKSLPHYGLSLFDKIQDINLVDFMVGIGEDGVYLFHRHDPALLKHQFTWDLLKTCEIVEATSKSGQKSTGLHLVNSEGSDVTLCVTKRVASEWLSLINGYYFIAHGEKRDGDVTTNTDMVISSELYEKRSEKRDVKRFQRFGRQLLYVKATYMQKTNESHPPYAKFLNILDQAIDNENKLTRLSLTSNDLTDFDFACIIDSLVDAQIYGNQHPDWVLDIQLEELILRGPKLSRGSLQQLSDILEYFPNLKSLQISEYRPLKKAVRPLAKALSSMKTLQTVIIEDCDLSSSDVELLENAVDWVLTNIMEG
mmetsp:Transcript_3218/g.4754  ORF Transcript_3218/g.4754 Transcript_3218/m.4754 type:complete len:511 (+) Transcript_3218:1-1533(+)